MNSDHLQRIRVKVVGVGDGGCNVINRMVDDGVTHFDLVAMNTNSTALTRSKAKIQVLLGESLLSGNGTGGNPEYGRKAALESRAEIEEVFAPAKLVYFVAGMGGGTGSGALPTIAQAARAQNARTVAIVSRPFEIEGLIRDQLAQKSIEALGQEADKLVVFKLSDLIQVMGNNPSMQQFFALADTALMWELIHHFLPNIRSS